MARYFAGYNRYGINVSYSSIGWQFLAFTGKAARDAFVEDNCYNRSGNVVCEAVRKADIPGINKRGTAIVAAVDAEYPVGCLGEIRDRFTGGYVFVDMV